MKMQICKAGTTHPTITETILCDVGNAAIACKPQLEILAEAGNSFAVANLAARFEDDPFKGIVDVKHNDGWDD